MVGLGSNQLSKASMLKEFFTFLWEHKLWWMIPIFLVLFRGSLIRVLAQGSPLAPFIYTLS
jgi:hypothetical protein